MSDEIIELRRRIEGLSDEELSIMLTAESDQYRPIALGYASSELKRRKLTLDEIGVRTLPEADRIYATQWNEYRKRRRLFWLVFATYVPGVAIIGVPLARLFRTGILVGVTAGLWMLAFVVTANYLGFWKCPRCGKPFFRKWWYHNSFARKCVHCELRKWT